MKSVLVNPGLPAAPVDIEEDDLRRELGFISLAYPFDDPVCLVHDDDGIANHRAPNRTVNGMIIPGPFYVLGVSCEGELLSLSPALQEKYLKVFALPETFPPGQWKVATTIQEDLHGVYVRIDTSWIPAEEDPGAEDPAEEES